METHIYLKNTYRKGLQYVVFLPKYKLSSGRSQDQVKLIKAQPELLAAPYYGIFPVIRGFGENAQY